VIVVGVWSEQVVPRVTDRALGRPAVRRARERVLAPARGVVVDLGSGSAPNLPLLPPAVTRVLAVEPSAVARRLAGPRIAASRVPVEHVGLDGAALPLAAASADTVVSTFTLCTIPDLDAALAEVRRVLRPDGQLLLLDHGLSPDPSVARWQHRLTGLQQRLFAGCHLERDIVGRVEQAGFTPIALETVAIPGPSVLNHVVLGAAHPTPG
jgi:ubiquinone/menaquinone biosynthesis C-methylase UbiE